MQTQEKQIKLDTYIESFERIKGRVNDDRVAAVILQEMARDARMALIRAERMAEREQSSEQPASDRQLEYLKDLGVKARKGLTKQEASALIDETLAKEAA